VRFLRRIRQIAKEINAFNLKLLVILEGRDATGKVGTIKSIVRHLSARKTIVGALNKQSYVQNKDWCFQRYTAYPIADKYTS
jgi:polyphosphate kinase 2 (PPK2 family)